MVIIGQLIIYCQLLLCLRPHIPACGVILYDVIVGDLAVIVLQAIKKVIVVQGYDVAKGERGVAKVSGSYHSGNTKTNI